MIGAVWTCALASASPSLPAAAQRTWRFQVLLDGKPVGEHDFTVSGEPGSEQVRSRARFTVKALFIPVYGYDHEDAEVWRDGCLARMEARTSDNGHESSVLGTRTSAGFEVRGPGGTRVLPGCVSSFAYWDRAHLAGERLLNPQSGEYEAVSLTDQGTESLVNQGRRVAAEHYHMVASGFPIDLWYSKDGAWLALESRTAQGRTLRYELL